MDLPIACTLTPEQLSGRRADLAELARRSLRSRAPIAGGERLLFAPGTEVEAQLRDVVAAEAACCAFLTMDLRPGADTIILDVTGPAEAAPIIRELFA